MSAGATGAVAGQFAVFRLARGAQIAGQGAIGAAGSWVGGGDAGAIGQAAAFGAAGEFGGQMIDRLSETPAGAQALNRFTAYLDEWADHQLAGGASPGAIDQFKALITDFVNNRRSELAGVMAGWLQGLREKPEEGR